jgi:hypothetical protein
MGSWGTSLYQSDARLDEYFAPDPQWQEDDTELT